LRGEGDRRLGEGDRRLGEGDRLLGEGERLVLGDLERLGEGLLLFGLFDLLRLCLIGDGLLLLGLLDLRPPSYLLLGSGLRPVDLAHSTLILLPQT